MVTNDVFAIGRDSRDRVEGFQDLPKKECWAEAGVKGLSSRGHTLLFSGRSSISLGPRSVLSATTIFAFVLLNRAYLGLAQG